ncbi:uveal autoantigen with coiled-coil domains and ankyrin repeats protein-like [Myzus persicae]|uniref:uveal autoantigen with coiled-coil domains and ankyrin repeats protein-like n=1 Tax=Myzus persicae TaxID=13164 RepID=UPI000B933BE9|nr:uveal autoantigen with coiled-coil domains and ankyrin repeats protein-like [Myzus persicae]
MDFEREFIPIWEESPEVYYDPVILELELDKIKKEFNEFKYESSELEKANQLLKEEITRKEKEKTDLQKLYKDNTVKLPLYQSKVTELNKTVSQLNTDKKNMTLVINVSKEKREELEKKYKEATDRYITLMNANKQLEKVNAKYKLENAQELKDKDRIKAENDKTKSRNDELEIQSKGLKAQINHHEDELRSKEIVITGLARDNKILSTKIENTLIKLSNSEERVKFLEKKIKTMNKECSESITKYSSLLNENNCLKSKLNESEELTSTVEEMKANERSLYKQMNQQLEKQKTKYIYTGEDITVIKRKLEECMKQNLSLTKKFSNLDCPFYQSKYGKNDEDTEPEIKCGSLREKHYENKLFALEQVIKTLHLKIESQEERHLKYRDVVIKSLYHTKAAEKKVKSVNLLLEEQKYKIIYDKLEVLSKESKIQKLEIQKDNFDYQCKLLNRQSTLLCKKIKDYNLKIESMKKESIRANKIFRDAEQKNDELQNKTEQLEKSTENIEMQLLNNSKCKKLQQLEVNKMKSSIEELKEENKLLQFKLMTEERRLAYLQNKFNKLYNEKERKINSMRIPKNL